MSRRRPIGLRRVAAAGALAAAWFLAVAPAAAGNAVGETSTGTGTSTALAPVAALPADVDDFSFASFDAVYDLGRDDEGHSTLTTTERLVAVFPDFDQNHGIRRAIPERYDGHPTEIRITSVTDGEGVPRSFETASEDGFLLVTIAARGFVHGEQTYVISYDQRYVTHVPDDAAIDEFYWDVNGTGWAQPFGRVTAELRVEPEIAAAFTGDAACYRGWSGSGTPCESLEVFAPEVAGDAPTAVPFLRASAANLGPYENLTIAAAFEQGTFTPRDDAFLSSPVAVASGVGALGALGAALTALVLRATRWRNHPGRGIVVAEYEPPPGVSIMEAADLVGAPGRGVTASILELAVEGRVRIVETSRKKYAVEFARGDSQGRDVPDPGAGELVRLLFPRGAHPGERRPLKGGSDRLATGLQTLRSRARKFVTTTGYRRSPDPGLRLLVAAIAVVGAIVGVVFAIFAFDQARGGWWPAVALGGAVVLALVAIGAVSSVRPLTERGRDMHDRLEGLRLYIRLAEADRLRVLQSPSGALRVPSGASAATSAGSIPDASQPAPLDSAAVLKLNERLLPYAVLFGLEREWARELAALYEARGEQPGWYSGRGAFDAVAFSTGMASFSSAASTTWSGSSSSSSSSGSGGGGSSGAGAAEAAAGASDARPPCRLSVLLCRA
ncbi:DUF2207 domain-containing protein [Agromyces protaetiae]|uniref:DUF2207 domain-containing protein n=1 Tax=Agromyces protaetiae TaxID=2509455 RepID=A0A4P6FEX4_9MICO|nr:DUF2207 domain-containing protein [Agromyces protaetiae]QAY74396.1 DUF2207 domain-containing protein [Agromyces protaetiae]